MKLDSRKYLFDIKYAIDLIEEFIGGHDFDQYINDLKTKSAVERQLGIIGEAVNSYKKETGDELSDTKEIIGFRNRLIHNYDNLEDEIIWTILKQHLPGLKEEVISLL